MKEEIDENKEKEVIQKAYKYNVLSVIGAVLIILANQAHNLLELEIGLLVGFVTVILQVLALVSALLATRKLRKLYPDVVGNRRKNIK
ncbi:hypothetical protein N42HA_02055 [Lactococcus lactis]|uniref:Uncharacterized protein n=1 Tax=Lactococcus lactis subsp. lactis TaxID=1360 RepID=A0A0V8EPC9_LACLL|nr:hypothetical protein [Lactococcus lactis]KSU27353.1 hypothetical protein N42_0932 [Lactococcus lactis subsp. lactis]MDU0409040.1 hypothetical protein [Lactococcus lactis]NRD16617.1 hypothetical protein [Lactococcus lactis subsp. lactis]